jgi:hypothetical protein
VGKFPYKRKYGMLEELNAFVRGIKGICKRLLRPLERKSTSGLLREYFHGISICEENAFLFN